MQTESDKVVRSYGIRFCARCSKYINKETASGWEVFIDDTNRTMPICKNCHEKEEHDKRPIIKCEHCIYQSTKCKNNDAKILGCKEGELKLRHCNFEGRIHTVRFLCFKRSFVACEVCGQKHDDTGWKFSL